MSLILFPKNQRLALGVSMPAAYARVLSQAAPESQTLGLSWTPERLVGGRYPVWASHLVANQSSRRLPNLGCGLFPSYFPL
jgi:hypothetical protein